MGKYSRNKGKRGELDVKNRLGGSAKRTGHSFQPAADVITVTVTPTDAGFDLSTYLIAESDCPNYTATVLAGADTGFGGDFETFTYSASPGTYVVVHSSGDYVFREKLITL